ncbi:hypothetical protein BV22DRAFT_1186673, partial [Leucogyrophana mollusca]
NFGRDFSDGRNTPFFRTSPSLTSALVTLSGRRIYEHELNKSCRTPPTLAAESILPPLRSCRAIPVSTLPSSQTCSTTWPGPEPLDEQEAKDYGAVEDFDTEGEREVCVFTLWLSSLGVEPGVFNLFENIKDGLVILQAFDTILPGSVDIGVKPNQSTLSRFKQVENSNYAVELGKQNGMHLVGFQCADVIDGSRTLVLGLVWQLMRFSLSL